jgi:mannose-6-phosphate isomerase-like protein (cupin superfamily)
MDYVRSVDDSVFPKDAFHSHFMASLESCIAILSRVPPRLTGPALHVHPADQLYYVLRGRLKVQLGDTEVIGQPDDLIFIPAGVPHRNINEWDEEEVHFELIAPAPRSGRPLSTPATADPVHNGAAGLRRLDQSAFTGRPFDTQQLADRSTGSDNVRVYYARVQPGAGGPATHIHDFDQLYWILQGTMQLEIALKTYSAGPNTLVVLPAGVPHRNWNDGPDVESHLAVLAPAPYPGEKLDQPVSFAAAGAAH